MREPALQNEPSSLPSVLNALADGVIMVDDDGIVVFANDASVAMCGARHDAWIGQPVRGMVPALDLAAGSAPREIPLFRPGCPARWLEAVVVPGGAADGAAWVVTLRDVTAEVGRREAGQLCSTVVNRTDRGVMVLDGLDRITYVNPAFTHLLGYRPEDVLLRDVSVALSAEEADMAVLREFRYNLRTRRAFEIDLRARSRAGREIWLSTAVSPVRDDGAADGDVIVLLADKTQAMELQGLRQDVTTALSSAMDFNDVMSLICKRVEAITPDVVVSILLVTDEGTAWMAGRSAMPESFASACDGMVVGPMVGTCGAAIYSGHEVLTPDIETDPRWTPALRDKVRPLGLIACWSVPVRLRDGTVAGSLALYFRDRREPTLWHRRVVDACIHFCTLAVEQERARARIAQLAHYDAVTGLPNRTWLREHLAGLQDRPGWCGLTLIAIDLDQFRTIRDGLGGAGADELLETVAQRLKRAVGQDGILTRTGEDEFSIVTGCGRTPMGPGCCVDRDGFIAVDHASVMAGAILRAMEVPIVINGLPFTSGVSVGICAGGEKGGTVDTLLRNTRIAVSRARDAGGNCYRFFSPAMNQRAHDRVILSSVLGTALASDRLRLVYQPQVSPHTGAIHGVEALARWRDPVRGDISPMRFIPLAEEAGLIQALGEWALRKACGQMAQWMADGIGIPSVSVNLSARHFREPGLPAMIGAILQETGIPPDRLMVEMTESTMIADLDSTIQAARAIRALGVGLSMDDFGTGFSTLANLVNLPLNEVKIDRSFVDGLGRVDESRLIVNAVIGIGRNLGMSIVAEGVETKEQLALLDELGCPVVQGFLISHPLEAERLPEWVHTWQQSYSTALAPLPAA
ncbi:EAL domain-containing protein [Gluconacetobacter takamatsuzukensis]|uniref:EAL domain-containing protein n=1 Tax=Gluconacetobacter takamatsuzukensis TaxID=1286190 RepID=A0A7W4KBM4_9PROT|nr:EAL domain-containing protein [Gluconacetobacter takamatsuzukensis]MBB2203865.1 EAL domain-containing protein [Gluconacetobacter takamatsuzukensis]